MNSNQSKFAIPTNQEIDLAYRTMLPEMTTGAADKMGRMTSRNPMLQYQIRELLNDAAATAKAGGMTPAMAMESVVASAMAYGLHLGIHIGMARRGKDPVQ